MVTTPAIESSTLVHALLSHATRQPKKPAFVLQVEGRESVRTFGALLDESLRFAGLYRDAGVAPGDVVLLFLRTRPDAYAAFLGATLIGAVPSFMPCPTPKQHPDHYWSSHRSLFDRIRPRAVVAAAPDIAEMTRMECIDPRVTTLLDIAAPGPALPPEDVRLPDPAEACLLQHSSGTTGLKKGIVLSYAAINHQVHAHGRAIAATADDILVSWLPIYHDMGLIGCTIAPVTLGQTVIALDPLEWSAQPDLMLRAIERHRATFCWLPNFAFEHLMRSVRDDRVDLSSMRLWNDCSEICKPDTLARFAARFAIPPERFVTCYGMAETVLATTQTPPGRPPRVLDVSEPALREERRARPPRADEARLRLLSCGMPIEGLELRLVDASGATVAEGGVGEITVRGACLFDGYHRLPDLTAERVRDGWYHTRDLGFIEAGEVFVLGRLDDLIIVHGRNIYAHEVEAAANLVDGVKPGRVVAFGVPNEVLNSDEIVVVAEVEAPDPSLRRRIKEQVFQTTGFTIREALVVDAGWLAKTTSGKISRERNRARYLQARRETA